MNKTFKKMLSSVLALSMVTAGVVLPTAVSADATPLVEGDTVVNEWKFDFGAEGTTPEEGYTLVTPDRNYIKEKDYGFLGIDDQSYKISERYDAFRMQEGQVIQLQGDENGIGSVGADLYKNSGEKYYPTRFALNTGDEKYFRVRATVTTLDDTKPANATLYTERKHPIYTDATIAAGEEKVAEFTVRTTPIYYEKSEPKGSIKDEMVNVCVLGENTALAKLEIQEVETAPTLWVLGDSTVTDGNCSLPFFRLQNYTGVGTGLTKYIPRTWAMVNEGEGGLNAADNYHWDMVKSRIKAGDYLYLEYGHNHKSDGAAGYVAALNKYYDRCHEVGANLIIVSPIERINNWDSTNKVYTQSLDAFATAGENYVAGKVTAGATDIAFVDLNDFSIDFYNKITADNNDEPEAIQYYFQTAKGGGTDTTHPNDAGADSLAYEFMKAAKAVTDTKQAAVLKPMLDNMTGEVPSLVSAEIMAGGVGGDAWPTYIVPSSEKYPVTIDEVVFNEAGELTSVKTTVKTPSEVPFGTYGIIVVTITDADGNEKGKIYATAQVDNSTGNGKQVITEFTSGVTLAEGDTYTAVVLQADDTEDGLKVTENGLVYSAVYAPTDIEKNLIFDEDNETNEDFDYYGATYDGATTSLNGLNGWTQGGSAGISNYLNETAGGIKYVEMTSDGAKMVNGVSQANQGSFSFFKDLSETIGSTGRYIISADLQYVSGGGLTFGLGKDVSDKNIWGNGGVTFFTIGKDGVVTSNDIKVGTVSALDFTPVKGILDMDLATMTVTVGSSDPVTIELANYDTTELTVSPENLTDLIFGGSKVAFDVKIANLTVAKLKDQKLPQYDMTVIAVDNDMGTVSFTTPAPTAEPTLEPTLEPTAGPSDNTDKSETANEPVTVLASENAELVEVEYANGKATVKANGAVSAVFVEAVYTDGTLTSVKTTPLSFTEAGTKDIEVAENSKIMIWDSLEGMKPIRVAEIVPTAAPDQIVTGTYDINTIITAKAEVKEGFVFMGWLDNACKTVSMDAEYAFRLRDNTVLTANFVKEPGVADVTNFSLTATEANVKAAVGATTTMQLVDPVDSAGTPVAAAKVTDITWSCAETGVTVSADGVVTFGETFSMGDALTKKVTITGTLNGVSRTYDITVFGYEYYENMVEGSTNYTGLFMTIGGKTAIVFPGASTTKTYTLSSPVTLDTATTIKYDNAWSGQNTCGQKRTLNFKNSSGTVIFSMYYSWGGLFVNGTELAGAIKQDTYSTITVAIDPTTSTVTVTSGENSATTTLAADAGNIASVDFVSESSVPGPESRALGISNFTIIK